MTEDGGMKHSLAVRKILNSTLCNLLGPERVEDWFIVVLPQAEDFSSEPMQKNHWKRILFFVIAYGLLFLLSWALLEGIRWSADLILARKRRAREKERANVAAASREFTECPFTPLLVGEAADTPRRRANHPGKAAAGLHGQDCTKDEAEKAAEKTRQRMKHYNMADIRFSAWHHVYIFLCLGLDSYAFLNDYLNQTTGLDFELYFPYGFCTVCWHVGCLVYLITVACRTNAPVPRVKRALFESANPFEMYFGALRDAVAGGVLAQYCFGDHEGYQIFVSGFCSFVTVVCIFLPNPFIYCHMHSFRDFQESFWPIFMEAERLECAGPGKPSQEQQESKKRNWKEWVLPILDRSTRWHKRAAAYYGDIPQAVFWLLFLLICNDDWRNPLKWCWKNLYILVVTILAIAKSFFVYKFRSRILCWMAKHNLRWSHLIPNELEWVTSCSHCSNVYKSKACRRLLKDEETNPEVRVAAMDALGQLYDDHTRGKDKLTDEEIFQIQDTILWEVGTSSEDKMRVQAKQLQKKLFERDPAKYRSCWKAGVELRRLRSDDPDEKKDAIRILAKEHPEFASAYIRDLTKLLTFSSRSTMLPSILVVNSSAKLTCTEKRECAEEPEDERKVAELEEVAKNWSDTRKVREAAACALGSLGKLCDPENLHGKPQHWTEKEINRLSAAVEKVAPDVLQLLRDGDNRFLRSAALTAVVGFRGKAAVTAVDEAVKLVLDEKLEDDHRKLAEITLVELLPHLPKPDLKVKVCEVAGKLLNSTYRREAGHNVLSRLGGEGAEAVLEVLQGWAAEAWEEWLGELKAVLECQNKSAKCLASGHSRGLNLVLDTHKASMNRARGLVKQLKTGMPGDVFKLLKEENIQFTRRGASENIRTLQIFMTDLEVDDTLFIAEMSTYLQESRRGVDMPLIVFCTELEEKDAGDIFEMKILFAALMLGRVDLHILTPKPEETKKKKPPTDLAVKMDSQRTGSIKSIADKIKAFDGDVEYYICAPTRGNLCDIVDSLKAKKDTRDREADKDEEPQLSGPQQRSVHVYSGVFNMKNTTSDDLTALYTLVGKDKTLTDVSKFPFFGYNESVYSNFTDFALPSFAPLLSHRYPLIAAVWNLLNDALNKNIVHPDKVMQIELLHPGQQKAFDTAKKNYEDDKMQEYALTMCKELEAQMVKKKVATLRAMACGCCDAPLCDQILFLRRWAGEKQPLLDGLGDTPEQSWIHDIRGTWVVNKKEGHTSVDTRQDAIGLKASQPVMREPHDVEALYMMREALQDYTFKHLEHVYPKRGN